MSDPLTILVTSVPTVAPDDTFARALRHRVQRALSLPEGVVVTDVSLPQTIAAAVDQPVPRPAAIPYLSVDGASAAIDWYVEVFGASLVGDPIVMPDGRIGHSELSLGGGVLYLSDAHPELGVVAPTPGQASVSLMLAVDDTDATLARVETTGGRRDRDPYDGYGHRNAWVYDPFGHRWGLQGPIPAPAGGGGVGDPIRHGDVGYVSWWTPDVAMAATFYRAVLGWEYAPGSADQGRQITSASMPMGLWGEQDESTLFCTYVVDSTDEAVAVIRSAGGSAEDPTEEPYGRVAMCADDQGMRFSVYEGRASQPRPAVTGRRHGDLSYITYEVQDGARAHAFYGTVFGWDFDGGTSEDRWRDDDPVPMFGMPGGHAGVVVPMWRVDDIAAAVTRVREAGGTSTDPERRPYGTTAQCTDDQGGRFYLGQL